MYAVPDPSPVDIVIPVYNAWSYTSRCLASLRAYTRPPYRIILIDNGSQDETPHQLAGLLSAGWPLSVIRNPENLGFTLAINQGLAASSADYVVLLNNDTLACPGWIEGLLLVAGLDPRTGIVGPKILWPGRNCILATGGLVFTRSATRLPPGRGALRDDPRFSVPEDRQYVEGCCMLVTREVLQRVGAFDEIYAPAYYEDADYCFRARAEGFRVVYSPFAEIYHFATVTANAPEVKLRLAAARGQERIFRRRWSHQFNPE